MAKVILALCFGSFVLLQYAKEDSPFFDAERDENLKRVYWLSLVLLCSLTLAGCNLQSGTIAELYENELEEVSEISILDGRTGEKTIITDSEAIDSFLEDMEDIMFIPSEDQSHKEGYIYAVSLFEGETETFSFSSARAGDHYYSSEPSFHPIVDHYLEGNEQKHDK